MSETSITGTVVRDNLVRAGVIGRKDDTGKSPVVKGFMEYFPTAIAEVARVSEFGAKKYDWGNWRFVDNGAERYTEALGRHLLAPGTDSESGLEHAAHAAWNAMARLELLLANK